METPIISTPEPEGRRVCRVMSKSEKKGRFTVENLHRVRCVVVSEMGGLLTQATPSTTHDENGIASASLTLKMREPKGKNGEAEYTMVVTESTLSECGPLTNPDDKELRPHVIICFLETDDRERTIERLQTVRQLIVSSSWDCPVLLVAYRGDPSCPAHNDVISLLKDLASLPTLYRCIEATALGKRLIRHSLAVAVLGARPIVAMMKGATDLRIDDMPKQISCATKVADRPRTMEKAKMKARAGCRLQ